MATKCPKCGGELVQTTPEIAKCKECGAAFKRKAPVEGESKKKGAGKNKGKEKGKHGILKTVAIVVLGLGILGTLLPDSNEGDKKERSEKKKEDSNSVWAHEDTDLEDFEYYVDGDKIHINGYKGKGDKLKIGSKYKVDGTKARVFSISDAPFIFAGLESIIISEGVETLDATVFNSCEAKYIFIPSTISNVEDRFWDYFFQVEKLYYGGTQEQWDAICNAKREDIDCRWIYCNVKVEELGEDDSEKETVSMDANSQKSEGENRVENAGSEDVARVYGAIEDFSYEVQGDVVSLGRYNGSENIIEIRPTYVIDGVEYRTDISNFYASGNSVGTIIIDEGFSEVNTAIFNSSDVHTVFFPRSMTNIYDYTLAYMHTSDGNLNKIYYAGTQDEWNAIFRRYERTKVEDAWAGKDPEQIGHSIADKLNEVIGVEYKPEEFEYHFSASPDELKQ